MQAIHSALRLSRRLRHEEHRGPGSAVVYGFPYLDTLKMCGRKELCDGVEFFGFGDERDLNTLKFLLSSRAKSSPNKKDPGITCLITEFPSNPLLNIPDLLKLRALADEYNFLIIVDDTIGNFANLDLLKDGCADVICTSLTKIFNGRGDAIAGSLIIGSAGKKSAQLKRIMQGFNEGSNHGDLYVQDADAVSKNSVDFVSRSSRINATAERLAEWLRGRDEVDVIYYPKFQSQGDLYERFMVKGEERRDGHVGGYGGLFSIVLKDDVCERTFYDTLEVCKGPR
jgi:cystathionine gamma-synthase